MTSMLHVRSVDVSSAPAFGAQTDLTQPVPKQAAAARLSRDAFGRWNGAPAAFGLRTTPVLDGRGDADSLRVSQTVDVITLLVAAGVGGQLQVLPTALIVPAGVHTARFVKVNPSGLPQVVSPWFAVRVPLDAHDVHAPVQAGALAASLELGAYAQCIVLLALPIAALVTSIAGGPVLTPLHPITGVPDATLAFAVADHARSFATTPIVMRHGAIEYFGTLERVAAATGVAESLPEDARARFAQSHGPAMQLVVGDLVELVRYRDAMAFETRAADDDVPIEITYAYERTVELASGTPHVFDDIAAGPSAVVYNMYCAHPYALSVDGVVWSPVVRSAHLATRVRAPLHVRLVGVLSATASFTLARYLLGADPTMMHLVYERAQTVGISTFGDAPIVGEQAAVGPFTLFADVHARNALVNVPTGAFLHNDRSIIAPTPLRGACLYVADVRATHLAPYTRSQPHFESRTTIGGLTPGGSGDLLFQTPEVRIRMAAGRDVDTLRVSGSLLSGGDGAATQVVAVVAPPGTGAVPAHVPALARVALALPAPTAYSMVPTSWGPEMAMISAAPGDDVSVQLDTIGGDYYFTGTTSGANPTLHALGASLAIGTSAASFPIHLDGVPQVLPLTLQRTAALTYNQGRGTIIAAQNTRVTLVTTGPVPIQVAQMDGFWMVLATNGKAYWIRTMGGPWAEIAPVEADDEFVQIASNPHTALFLTRSHKVYALGANPIGQLGLGDTLDRTTLTLVPTIAADDPVVRLRIAYEYYGQSLALTQSGKAYGTGFNQASQTGSAGPTKKTFALVPSIVNDAYIDVAAGLNHSLFLTASGKVYIIGMLRGYESSFALTLVSQITEPIRSILASNASSICIASSGNAYYVGAWSRTPMFATFALIPPINGETIVAATGHEHLVVVTASGKAYSLGFNTFGQLGVNDDADRTSLTRISHPEGDTATFTHAHAAGWNGAPWNGTPSPTTFTPTAFTMLRSSSGALYACGRDYYNATTGANAKATRPVAVVPLPGKTVAAVALYNNGYLLRTSTGEAYAYGQNDVFKLFGTAVGRFGLGHTSVVRSFTQVTLPEACAHVTMANSSTLYLTTTGKIYATGLNSSGELGLGVNITTDRSTPTLVPSIAGETFASVYTRGGTTMALTVSGKVYATGANGSGQLALGGVANRSSFARVTSTDAAVFAQVRVGTSHTCFLSTLGKVYTAGLNSSGQLGVGDDANRTSLTQIPAIPGETFAQIEVCDNATFVMTASGKVYATGANAFGELGVGDTLNRNVLTPIVGVDGVTFARIFAGVGHVFGLTTTGAMYATGRNSSGQLGTGDVLDRRTFTLVPAIAGEVVQSVAPGEFSTFFLTVSGTVYTCGMGFGFETYAVTVPTRVTITV